MGSQRLGEFEEIVMLAVGRLGDEAHSVNIQEVLAEVAGRDATLGAIYAALERLERKRHVRSRLEAPSATRGGRSKRHYTLTDSGRGALAEVRRVRERLWRQMRTTEDG